MIDFEAVDRLISSLEPSYEGRRAQQLRYLRKARRELRPGSQGPLLVALPGPEKLPRETPSQAPLLVLLNREEGA